MQIFSSFNRFFRRVFLNLLTYFTRMITLYSDLRNSMDSTRDKRTKHDMFSIYTVFITCDTAAGLAALNFCFTTFTSLAIAIFMLIHSTGNAYLEWCYALNLWYPLQDGWNILSDKEDEWHVQTDDCILFVCFYLWMYEDFILRFLWLQVQGLQLNKHLTKQTFVF